MLSLRKNNSAITNLNEEVKWIMTFQILVATMYQKDRSLLERMKIDSDAIVVNQTDCEGMEEFAYHGFRIIWVDTTDRGLSRSRNEALRRANADICLLADDDEVLRKGYSKIVIGAFSTVPKADLMTFNIESIGNTRKRYRNTKIKRLRFFNIMRYGSARIAFKLDEIKRHNIKMNVLFGAGESISNGEDSIFLHDCLRHKLKAYSFAASIADIHDETSTWFKGYDEKFFKDKGAIFAAMSPAFAFLWIAQYAVRHYKLTGQIGFVRAFSMMCKGKKDYFDKIKQRKISL